MMCIWSHLICISLSSIQIGLGLDDVDDMGKWGKRVCEERDGMGLDWIELNEVRLD